MLCALPWYVAISARLGNEYFQRFIVHDLLDRSFSGVHGDRGLVGYYVEQLSYGLFPWGALLPIALLGATPTASAEAESRASVVTLLRLWFTVAFALFSALATHFHHYIFPAVPPAALLIGLWIAEHTEPEAESSWRPWGFATTLSALVAVALATSPEGPARYLRLFTYNYARATPPSLELQRPALLVLGLAASVALFAAASNRLRARALQALALAALLQTGWLFWSYLPRLSEHRSQRVLFAEYLRLANNEQAPLGAYALNWKGELFYSGGAIAQFDCGFGPCRSGAFQQWLTETRGRRVFVLTEHSRVETVRRIANQVQRTVTVRTTPETQLHFTLVEVSP